MNADDFQKLKEKIENLLILTDDNVLDKSIQISNYYMKFLQIHSKECKDLKSKFHQREKIYGELYHQYKYNFEYSLDTKNEVEAYIKADDKYYKAALEYSQQEIQVKFLEQSLDHINNMGFRIKNYIDLVKIKKGLM